MGSFGGLRAVIDAVEDKLRQPGPYGPLEIFLAYVASTVLVLPLLGLHFAAGYAYGTLKGTCIVLLSEVTAACLIFLLTRYALRSFIRRLLRRRLGSVFDTFDDSLRTGALKMVVLLRLSP